MLTAEAEAWRRQGIGGSDARVIASGVPSQWKKLRLEKLGIVTPVFDIQTQLLMAIGTAIEGVALDHYARTTEKVKDRGRQVMWKIDDYFRCTLDAMTASNSPVQVKFHSGDKSSDELTEYYWPQLQHEMMVTEKQELVFIVLFGHYGRFFSDTVLRDQQFLEAYQLRCFQFKHYVESNQLPDDMAAAVANDPEATVEAIKQNIPRLRDHLWQPGDNIIKPLAESWLETRVAAGQFDAATESLKAQVPDDARTASWFSEAGTGIQVTVNKRGAKQIRMAVASKPRRVS